jgi:2-phosphosulfolactate phosphatase
MGASCWQQQLNYDVVFDWGSDGLGELYETADIVVIVDVLSFSTCVDVATQAGAVVFPCRWKDERAQEFAQRNNAHLASSRLAAAEFTLSPTTLTQLRAGDRLVLPSPNGSQLCTLVNERPIVAGCIRNASAVARYLNSISGRKLILAAGELWPSTSQLRPALEDLLGAAAIIHALSGSKSPEAKAAENSWIGMQNDVGNILRECASGRELIERGYGNDVDLASALDSSAGVPLLSPEGYFTNGMSLKTD